MSKIIYLFVLLFINLSSSNASSYSIKSETDDLLNDFSKTVINSYCSKKSFLDKSKIKKSECKSLLAQYASECKNYISPFVPTIEGTEEDKDIVKIRKIQKLGVLYSMCVRAIAYEMRE